MKKRVFPISMTVLWGIVFTTAMHNLTLGICMGLMMGIAFGLFDSGEYDYRFDGAAGDANSFCDSLKSDKRDRVNPFIIRRLSGDERQAALDLACVVFSEYESPDYSAEGTEEFRKCLHDEDYLHGLQYYGAFDGEKLIGESWMAGITVAGSAQGCFDACLKITRTKQ